MAALYRMLIYLLVFAVSILIALTWLDRFNWTFEMVSNFLPYYLVLQTGFVIYFARKRKRLAAVLALLFLLLGAVRILPACSVNFSKLFSKPSQTGLKILSFNVSSRNHRIDSVIDYLRSESPDVFGLIEINREWGERVAAAFPGYQVKMEAPVETRYGLALFSRLPFQKVEFRFAEITGVPSIVADIDFNGKPLTIVFSHPFNPLDTQSFLDRNLLFKKIALARNDFRPSLVVMGDLNTPPWSLYFRMFVKALDLEDTRKGYGIRGTWPAYIPLLRIPIDHILTSADLVTLGQSSGPRLGSDHRPIQAILKRK